MKIYDMVIATGSYTNAQGEEKKRYKNIGVVLENENGPYILLDRSFNPAGVGEGENVIVSLFKPKEKVQSAPQRAPQQQGFNSETPPF